MIRKLIDYYWNSLYQDNDQILNIQLWIWTIGSMKLFLFVPFSSEFSPRDRLINTFPSYFSFYSLNSKSKESLKTHLYNLDNITLQALADSPSAIVSYAKSTHLENTSLWYIPCQQLKPTFHSSYLSHNTSHSGDATI